MIISYTNPKINAFSSYINIKIYLKAIVGIKSADIGAYVVIERFAVIESVVDDNIKNRGFLSVSA